MENVTVLTKCNRNVRIAAADGGKEWQRLKDISKFE
jgi:hypothetical protein